MKYRLNDEKFFADVTDNIAIIIDVQSGIYYGLNEVTTNVYENIVNGVDTDELLAKLSEIEGFNDEVRARYVNFVNDLIKNEMILIDTNTNSEVNINFNKFEYDENELMLVEYPDASELLLADPIHQVKSDTGWKPNK